MTPEDCNHSNAVEWIAAPEPQQGLAACMIYGQEYVSQARLVIPGKTYPKVYCQPPLNIGKATSVEVAAAIPAGEHRLQAPVPGARVFPARTAPITPPRSKPMSPATLGERESRSASVLEVTEN